MEDYYHEVTPNITDPRLAPEVRMAAPVQPPPAAPQSSVGGLFTSIADTKFIVLIIVFAIVVIIIIAYLVKTYAISEPSAPPAPSPTPPQPPQTQPPPQQQSQQVQPPPQQPVQTQQTAPSSTPTKDEALAAYKRMKVVPTTAPKNEPVNEIPDGAKSDEEISQLMENVEESQEEVSENQSCTEITSSGKQCKNRAKANGKCHVHSV